MGWELKKLPCPKCGEQDSRVVTTHTNQTHNYVRRKRECSNPKCKEIFLTAEVFLDHYNRVAKRSNFYKYLLRGLVSIIGFRELQNEADRIKREEEEKETGNK